MVLIVDPLAQGEARCPRCGRAAVVAADGEGWEVGCAGPSALCGGVWQGRRGDVLVDGVGTATMPLDRLRESICVIPQDPVIFR